MGLVLMPNEIRMNMSTLRIYLESATRRYQNVREKVYDYYSDEELTTEAFRVSKDKMNVFYRIITEAMIGVKESITGDIDTLTDSVGDEYLDEDVLTTQIKMLRVQCELCEANIKSLKAKKTYAGGTSVQSLIESYRDIIENLKEQIAILQEKLDFLYETESSTKNLFQSAMDLLTTIQNAIADAGTNVRTDNGFPEELPWLTKLGRGGDNGG